MSASSNAEHRAARDNDSEAARGEGQPDGDKERRPPRPSVFRRPAVLIGGGVLLLLLILIGLIWWWHASGFESTDDAFIDARTVRVAPRISGQVSRVLVTDNQAVHRGEVMVEIDAADAQSAL